jgi:5-methylcytosine-specific restriction protein A
MRENYHIGTTLTTDEWTEVLLDRELTNDIDIAILQAMYSFEEHKASASQIGLILGYVGKNTSSRLNLEMGRWGKRVVRKYPVKFTQRDDGTERKWDIFFDGWSKNRLFIWQIKKELITALEKTELTGDEQFPEEIPTESQEKLIEGAKKTITVNSYERNSKARKRCINHYRSTCNVCDLDFEKTYGELGKDFIHVHHLTKVADIGEIYEVNPIKDLRPVCPNCHAMLHKKEPPLTIGELKERLNK